jgi:hypothetical protein
VDKFEIDCNHIKKMLKQSLHAASQPFIPHFSIN